MTSTVTQAEIEEAGAGLEERMGYVTIMTEEDFDAMMLSLSPGSSSITPYTEHGSPLRTRPSAPEWLADHVVDPVYSDPFAVPAVLGAIDLIDLNSKARKEGGLFGLHYETKQTAPNGRKYVVLKGDAAQRAMLTKAHWRADHPKIVELGIGQKIGPSAIWGGVKVAVYAGVGFETFLWLFQEGHTFSDLLGGVAAELGKGLIASVAGAIAAFIFGAATTLAFVPAVSFIVVGFAAGVVLNQLDDHYQFKRNLQEMAAISLDWMRRNTGFAGEWTAAQYEDLRVSLDDWADGLRHGLDTSIDRSNERLESLQEEARKSPMAAVAYGQTMQSESMSNGVLTLIRKAIGD